MKYLLTMTLILTGLASAHAVEVGEQAPCVVLNHVAGDGSETEHCIRDPNQEGQFKLLEFFSVLCSDCMKNRPKFLALESELGHKATFRFLAVDQNEKLVRAFIAKNPTVVETALDLNRDARTAYGVVATPTLFVLDADNKVVFKHQGVLREADLTAIRKLIQD